MAGPGANKSRRSLPPPISHLRLLDGACQAASLAALSWGLSRGPSVLCPPALAQTTATRHRSCTGGCVTAEGHFCRYILPREQRTTQVGIQPRGQFREPPVHGRPARLYGCLMRNSLPDAAGRACLKGPSGRRGRNSRQRVQRREQCDWRSAGRPPIGGGADGCVVKQPFLCGMWSALRWLLQAWQARGRQQAGGTVPSTDWHFFTSFYSSDYSSHRALQTRQTTHCSICFWRGRRLITATPADCGPQQPTSMPRTTAHHASLSGLPLPCAAFHTAAEATLARVWASAGQATEPVASRRAP